MSCFCSEDLKTPQIASGIDFTLKGLRNGSLMSQDGSGSVLTKKQG